jgi:Neuraminidase (sialidase)
MRLAFLLLLTMFPFLATHAADKPVLELPPKDGNPRNSEGAFLPIRDGRLLFVYTHFTGGPSDHAAAHLAARVSADGGQTWSDTDAVVPTAKGRQNVMSVSLVRLKSGDVGLFYLVKNSGVDCRPYLQVSSDEGKTWGEPRLCVADAGYYVVNNDRVVRLSTGRLVMPAALHTAPDAKRFDNRSTALCYLSDDDGKTWRRSRTELESPVRDSKSGLQEPGVVELKSGRLMMLCRTDQRHQMRSYSDDGGDTWSAPEWTDFASPLSPASVKRIPKTGDLLLVWNDTPGPNRTPLTTAVSKDDGKTWQHAKNLETDSAGWYCYTAIEFAGDHVLLAYCAGNPKNRLGTTRVARLPVEQLYK